MAIRSFNSFNGEITTLPNGQPVRGQEDCGEAGGYWWGASGTCQTEPENVQATAAMQAAYNKQGIDLATKYIAERDTAIKKILEQGLKPLITESLVSGPWDPRIKPVQYTVIVDAASIAARDARLQEEAQAKAAAEAAAKAAAEAAAPKTSIYAPTATFIQDAVKQTTQAAQVATSTQAAQQERCQGDRCAGAQAGAETEAEKRHRVNDEHRYASYFQIDKIMGIAGAESCMDEGDRRFIAPVIEYWKMANKWPAGYDAEENARYFNLDLDWPSIHAVVQRVVPGVQEAAGAGVKARALVMNWFAQDNPETTGYWQPHVIALYRQLVDGPVVPCGWAYHFQAFKAEHETALKRAALDKATGVIPDPGGGTQVQVDQPQQEAPPPAPERREPPPQGSLTASIGGNALLGLGVVALLGAAFFAFNKKK